jgi:hypothetical protein
MGPAEVMVIGAVMATITLSVRAIAAAVVRYQENQLRYQAQQSSGITDGRLERIEHAVDAIAIEIERISEAQRFTTRLLNDRSEPSVRH